MTSAPVVLSLPGTPPASVASSSSATSSPLQQSLSTPIHSPSAASMAQRLQFKQTIIDTWSVREKLGLASAVMRSGDQNWVSVSRQMKQFSEPDRPADWFSQKNCALQYNKLLEKAERETPKRKRGLSDTGVALGSQGSVSGVSNSGETPGEAIVRKLTEARIKEVKEIITAQALEMAAMQEDIDALASDSEITEEEMDAIEKKIEEEEHEEAEQALQLQQWLQEREEKKSALQAALKVQSVAGAHAFKGAVAQAVANATSRRAALAAAAASQASAESGNEKTDDEMAGDEGELLPPRTPTKDAAAAAAAAEQPISPLLKLLLKSPSPVATNASSPAHPGLQQSPVVTTAGFGMSPPCRASPNAALCSSPTAATKSPKREGIVKDMSESLKNLFSNRIEGTESRSQEVSSQQSPTKTSQDSELLAKLLFPPATSGDVLADVTTVDLDSEVKEEEKKEEDNEDMEIDVEKDGSKDETELQKQMDEPDVDQKTLELSPTSANNATKSESKEEPGTKDEASDSNAGSNSRRSSRVGGSSAGRNTRGSSTKEEEESSQTKPILPPPASRETRHKKISERSDDLDSLEDGSARTSRGNRQAKKEDNDDASSTTSSLENRRLKAIKASDTELVSTGGRGRRGSGATSRSSSPTESEDTTKGDSESEPQKTPRRLRRRSGKATSSASATPNATASMNPTLNTDVDESGPSSPVSSDLGTMDLDNPDPKTFKKQALMLWHDITTHRYSNMFLQPVSACGEHNDYHSQILSPMDLATVKRNIGSGTLKNIHEMHRDVTLMFLNAAMYNSLDSELYERAITMARACNTTFTQFKATYQLVKSGSNPAPSAAAGTTPVTTATPARSDRVRGASSGSSIKKKEESRKRQLSEGSPGTMAASSVKKRRK